MGDVDLARRLRISNALMAVGFVCLSCLLGLITGDMAAVAMSLALFAAGYAVGVIWMDGAGLLPGGKLSKTQRSAVVGMLAAAATLASVALALALGDIRGPAAVLAVLAVGSSVVAGAFSTWLAIR